MEENKNTNKKTLPAKFTLTVRTLVGAYLLYVSYGLYGNLGKYTGNEKIAFLIFMILFIIVGCLLIGISGIAYMRGAYIGGKLDGQDDQIAEETTEHVDEEVVVVVNSDEEKE